MIEFIVDPRANLFHNATIVNLVGRRPYSLDLPEPIVDKGSFCDVNNNYCTCNERRSEVFSFSSETTAGSLCAEDPNSDTYDALGEHLSVSSSFGLPKMATATDFFIFNHRHEPRSGQFNANNMNEIPVHKIPADTKEKAPVE